MGVVRWREGCGYDESFDRAPPGWTETCRGRIAWASRSEEVWVCAIGGGGYPVPCLGQRMFAGDGLVRGYACRVCAKHGEGDGSAVLRAGYPADFGGALHELSSGTRAQPSDLQGCEIACVWHLSRSHGGQQEHEREVDFGGARDVRCLVQGGFTRLP